MRTPAPRRLVLWAAAVTLLALGASCGAGGAPGAGSGPSVERGVVYGHHGSVPLELDEYLPERARAAPAVIFVHGGGWVEGHRSEYAQLGPAFARAGMAGFSVDYTLCSATRSGWPLEVREVLQALAWIRRHAAALHVDPARIGVMGDSSGATLALEAAVLVGDGGRGGLQAAAGWSGPYDLPSFRPSPTLLGGTGAWLQTDLAWFTGCLPLDTPRCLSVQADASPSRHVRHDMAPVLIATSDRYSHSCEIVDPAQTASMAAALRAAGDTPEVDVLPLCAHGMGYRRTELARTIGFFASHLGLSAAQPTGAASTSAGFADSGAAGRST